MQLFQVSEFIETINSTLKETLPAELFGVEGEVSGFRVSQGQWVSFDLKDDKALLNVFMPVWNLRVPVEDGLRVRVFGQPRIYPKYGKFSLSAERVELAGEGALKKALALLRVRLEKEGLFDPSRKRTLPRFPAHIALITSRESAAYGDIVRVLGERWGGLEIDLYHVLVQGERAPGQIIAALGEAQKGEYDALVITRGGGSFEELMAFNDEQLVRAIRASRIPTLVAIGHERDLTLAEEAADVRGSTPTDCARRLVPDRADVEYELASLMNVIETGMRQNLERTHGIIDRALLAPGLWISGRHVQLQGLSERCVTGVRQWTAALADRLDAQRRLFASFDPKGVLSRGYAIIRGASGKVVSSVVGLQLGQQTDIVLRDGEVGATITKIGNKIPPSFRASPRVEKSV